MSEYQYYEWQTIDHPLSPGEREAVSGLSSHMETATSTQAIVTYSWGDFKHDPRQVLLQYFDAHLYMANWGMHKLMFRFPKAVIDPRALQPRGSMRTVDDPRPGPGGSVTARLGVNLFFFLGIRGACGQGQRWPSLT
jgi:hypothetical protein